MAVWQELRQRLDDPEMLAAGKVSLSQLGIAGA